MTHLAGSSTDFVELGVAEKTSGRVIVDVAVASKDLDRVETNLGALLGDIEDHSGTVLVRHISLVGGLGDHVEVGAGGVQRGVHVGELSLEKLERSDLLSESGSLMGVVEGDVTGGLHQSQRSSREHQSFVVQASHQHVDSLPVSSHDLTLVNFAIVENQLASVGSTHSELVKFW